MRPLYEELPPPASLAERHDKMPSNRMFSWIQIFVYSFIVGFSAVASPGPVSTAIVSQAPRRGWIVGPLVATGHSLMELGMITLIAVGLSAVLAQPSIQMGVALVGGILLIWMGGDMLWSALRKKVSLPTADINAASMTNAQTVRLGILTTISNPFWFAWWVTFVPSYLIEINGFGAAAISAFYFGHISADYAWDTALSSVIGSGNRFITNNVYRAIVGISGGFLLYLGISFLWTGWQYRGFL